MTHTYPPVKVEPDDDGIRPAGLPDECFYCQRKIGSFHKDTCVILQRVIRAVAVLTWEGQEHRFEFVDARPISWDEARILFYYNDSGSCFDNRLDTIEAQTHPPALAKIRADLAAVNTSGDPHWDPCSCNIGRVELPQDWDTGLLLPTSRPLQVPEAQLREFLDGRET